jgi:hypothetical protein
MIETLEPYVKKMLDGGVKTAEEIAKFIESQTPELGREIILWGSVSEMALPFIALIGIVLSISLHNKYKKADWYNDCVNGDMPVIIPNLLFLFIAFITFVVQIMDVLYPLIAPRLFILDKISEIIK